jgi:hypothetical protein
MNPETEHILRTIVEIGIPTSIVLFVVWVIAASILAVRLADQGEISQGVSMDRGGEYQRIDFNYRQRTGCLDAFGMMFGAASGWFTALSVFAVILVVGLLAGCCVVALMIGGAAGA